MDLLYGLRGGYLFSDRVGWFIDFTRSNIESVRFDRQVDLDAARTGLELFLSPPDKQRRFYVSVAGGVMDVDLGTAGSFNRPLASVGIGQRFEPTDRNRFRWEVRAEQSFNADDQDLAGEEITNLQALIAITLGMGGRKVDSDGDGVYDKRDACPGTPRGAVVDARGCPVDSDGDGVPDGLDRCPDTPRDWPVDEDGCPLDSDGDGVYDGTDECPDTPKGASVDDRGCPEDSDGDGVYDGLDRCPDTPKGASVDARGCPRDSDGDGVFDGIDRCPDTPKGATVDERGCPKPERLFETRETLVLEGVNFAVNSAALTADSSGTLDRVAASLAAWPEIRVEIGGHTDSTGSAAYNQQLSQRRAESVRTYLVAKGIDGSRLEASGYGESNPIADNGTDAGRAQNRRVELKKLD